MCVLLDCILKWFLRYSETGSGPLFNMAASISSHISDYVLGQDDSKSGEIARGMMPPCPRVNLSRVLLQQRKIPRLTDRQYKCPISFPNRKWAL